MTTLTAEETVFAPLTVHDTCDRCGEHSRAIHRVAFGSSSLAFCNHHYNRYAATLAAQGGRQVEDISYIFDNEGTGTRDAASAVV